MKTIKAFIEIIHEISLSWNTETVDRWDEEYLSMTL